MRRFELHQEHEEDPIKVKAKETAQKLLILLDKKMSGVEAAKLQSQDRKYVDLMFLEARWQMNVPYGFEDFSDEVRRTVNIVQFKGRKADKLKFIRLVGDYFSGAIKRFLQKLDKEKKGIKSKNKDSQGNITPRYVKRLIEFEQHEGKAILIEIILKALHFMEKKIVEGGKE